MATLVNMAEGFPGQRMLVLPPAVVELARRQPVTGQLMPTDIGIFPAAEWHRRERLRGVDQMIVLYCVKGSGWCELGGTVHEIHRGQVLVIPPGLPHAYGATKGSPWTIHWFHCVGRSVPHHLQLLDVDAAHPVISLGDDTHWLALFAEVLETLEHGYRRMNLVYASLALAYLLGVTLLHRQDGPLDQESTQTKIERTIDYMKAHLSKPLRVATLAAMANRSESHYATLFCRQTGYPPMDYFIRLRIQRACQLLDSTALSVKQVAAGAGYGDPLYFSRVFRTVMEMSPSQYRMKRKG